VQADPSGDVPPEQTVNDYLKRKYDKPGAVFLGIVYRLDRPVSGIVVFARTTKAQLRLNQMFREKLIRKTYWAVVKDLPPDEAGSLDIYCGLEADYFPGRWAVAEMQKMGIPVTVSSDAHTPDTLVFGFSRAETMLRETGYRTVMMLKDGKWEERPV
jgi:23S rRNA-/tRNA-specific pseudouridylate synthase